MKKILLLIIIIIFLPYIYDKLLFGKETLQKNLPFPIGKSSQALEVSYMDYDGKTYSYSFFSPSESQQLIYNLNLSEKNTSLDIIKDQGCTHLVNGGFYDKLDKPIGLVIKDGLEVSPSQINSLFNGFLSATSSASFTISTKEPSLISIAATQTGPMLINKSTTQILKLITDDHERRVVLAIDKRNTAYFLVITLKDSEMEGPLLTDLPWVVSQIGKSLEIEFSDAINLDGGSASTFFTPDIHIREMSTIGSYFCFK